MTTSGLTPMMRQYLEIKEKHTDSVLFFRLGDFYEMFFDDAVNASRILNITLTSRGASSGKKVPMCGIPFHAADNYISRLIKDGQKVAICEQIEKPTPGKNIVQRQVTKIITPGTFIADGVLDEAANNYILSINPINGIFGLAYADISTGEFRVTEIRDKEDLFAELYKIAPSELLIPSMFQAEKIFLEIKSMCPKAVTAYDEWMFDHDFAVGEIKGHFRVKELSGFGCQDMKTAVGAAGALIKYLKNTQKNELANIDVIETYSIGQFMTLDWNSHRNLELIHSMEDMSQKGTLIEVLDRTKTPMGKRLLKRWILNPLLKVKSIDSRLDSVALFYKETSMRHDVREVLDDIYDIDRLSNKVSLGTANARDLLALEASLRNVSRLKNVFTSDLPEKIKKMVDSIGDFSDVTGLINSSISENPPHTIKDGGIIRSGFNEEVDELRDIISGGKKWIIDLQKQEIERTGINSLKVGYNKVFGYYIEVTNANKRMVPEDYVRKQTLANAERYITDSLKKHESKIITAQDRIKSLEYEIFQDVRMKVGVFIERLKAISDVIAEIDAISDLAEVAVSNGYVRPEISDNDRMDIEEGRHPVLEGLLKDKEFVPNDVKMSKDDGNIFIITGSNMAGKSTYIRQVALITIMAQLGSFVPAKKAQIGVVDRVFTRVGASDRLYKGMSTFMVEMLETANILNNATKKSLIILDEIGRGTSTYDGVSIAWAVVEYLCTRLKGVKTMFATHFHELTELSQILPGIKNYNLSIREWGEEVIFLYKVSEGSCDESFGIHVAKLAGMPEDVVSRAREILNNLQKDSLSGSIISKFSHENGDSEKQLDLFDMSFWKSDIEDEIKRLDTDNMTPMQGLEKLLEFKRKLGK